MAKYSFPARRRPHVALAPACLALLPLQFNTVDLINYERER